MKKIQLVLLFLFVLTQAYAQNNDYPCQNPPYFEISDELYANSPSKKMDFTHALISIFSKTESEDSAGSNSEKAQLSELATQQRVSLNVVFFNGVKTIIIQPREIKNDKIIVYFHGGAYRDEMLLFQWDMAIDIARKAGSPVYVVDYRLVPDHIFPAPIEDGMAVYNKLLESFEANQIVFMGDSAGGGLALGLAGKIRDENKPLPAQLILISPWLDLEGDNPEMPDYDDLDLMLSVEGVQQGGIDYVGENNLHQLDNPYGSPLLLNNLNDFPPVLLFIGTYEILYPDAILFKEKAEAQGMNITTVAVDGGFHVWLAAPAALVPESWQSRKQIASFINCGPQGERVGFSVEDEKGVTDQLFHYTILPNPTSESIQIKFNKYNSNSTNAQIEIYNMSGAKVYTNSISISVTNMNCSLPLNLKNGNYIVSVTIDGVNQSEKILVVNN
ncbi:MAG: alpha/beta hydrolase fold domain-containing protein [Chitinophagales bacterium]